jgi:hypothetical protein
VAHAVWVLFAPFWNYARERDDFPLEGEAKCAGRALEKCFKAGYVSRLPMRFVFIAWRYLKSEVEKIVGCESAPCCDWRELVVVRVLRLHEPRGSRLLGFEPSGSIARLHF